MQEHKVQQIFVIGAQRLIRAQGRAHVFTALKCVRARSSGMTAAKINIANLFEPPGGMFSWLDRQTEINVISCAAENDSLSEIITPNLKKLYMWPFQSVTPPPFITANQHIGFIEMLLIRQ